MVENTKDAGKSKEIIAVTARQLLEVDACTMSASAAYAAYSLDVKQDLSPSFAP